MLHFLQQRKQCQPDGLQDGRPDALDSKTVFHEADLQPTKYKTPENFEKSKLSGIKNKGILSWGKPIYRV